MEASFKLRHVWDLLELCLLESLLKKLLAGKICILDSSASAFHFWQFDIILNSCAQVAHLFLDVYNSCCNTICCCDILCRESPLAV